MLAFLPRSKGASHALPARHFATSGHGDGEDELGKMADPPLSAWRAAGILQAQSVRVRTLIMPDKHTMAQMQQVGQLLDIPRETSSGPGAGIERWVYVVSQKLQDSYIDMCPCSGQAAETLSQGCAVVTSEDLGPARSDRCSFPDACLGVECHSKHET